MGGLQGNGRACVSVSQQWEASSPINGLRVGLRSRRVWGGFRGKAKKADRIWLLGGHLGGFLGQRGVMEGLGRHRVQGQVELVAPTELKAGPRELVIPLLGVGDSLHHEAITCRCKYSELTGRKQQHTQRGQICSGDTAAAPWRGPRRGQRSCRR